ncbi:MAG: hypothetical protein ACTSRZ_18225 [Promethearchaeota archaeon]
MKIYSFDLDHENHPLVTIHLDEFEEIEEYLEVNYFYNKINHDVFSANC